eukprot:1157488-Pelagomonas_calceolata.AAC.5
METLSEDYLQAFITDGFNATGAYRGSVACHSHPVIHVPIHCSQDLWHVILNHVDSEQKDMRGNNLGRFMLGGFMLGRFMLGNNLGRCLPLKLHPQILADRLLVECVLPMDLVAILMGSSAAACLMSYRSALQTYFLRKAALLTVRVHENPSHFLQGTGLKRRDALWLNQAQALDVQIIHIKGKENGPADEQPRLKTQGNVRTFSHIYCSRHVTSIDACEQSCTILVLWDK